MNFSLRKLCCIFLKNPKKTFFLIFFLYTLLVTFFVILKRPINHNKLQNNNELLKNSFANLIPNKTKITINFSPEEGYANKLYSYISSQLIAILTDTNLFVVWKIRGSNLTINNYIEPPLNNRFTIINEQIKFNHDLCYLAPRQAWLLNKNTTLLTNTEIKKDCMIYTYPNISAYFMELCCNPVYYDKILKNNLASKKTVQLAKKAISNENMSETQKQEYLFKVGFEVGGNVLNKFWKPKSYIRDKVEFYVKNEFKENFVIGIQLRYYYLNKLFDTMKFIDCALQIEEEFNLKASLSKKKKFKWFISSDTQYFVDEIFSVYGNRSFTANGTISHIIDNPNGYEKAIVDMELLSRCDEIIITGGSTFGFVAAMKSGKLPYFVNGRDSNMTSCLRHSLAYPGLSRTYRMHAIF